MWNETRSDVKALHFPYIVNGNLHCRIHNCSKSVLLYIQEHTPAAVVGFQHESLNVLSGEAFFPRQQLEGSRLTNSLAGFGPQQEIR